ncbi:hypothetical protein FOL47_002786 [Perkinsus chesapeaki]|uniref:Uncharacterized protein n=1 Tax=Perkinsus chesapeaki TaxID=330153 RepID=A0A7J6N047_PERCH|nr:hypothetical protein FOL47_002786 [Perkinsus chesapeaki]
MHKKDGGSSGTKYTKGIGAYEKGDNVYPILSRGWIDLADTLEQLARLAMLEAYTPKVGKGAKREEVLDLDTDKVLGRLGDSGTLWDQDKKEDAIRLLLEEAKVNVCLRMLHEFKVWQYANWDTIDDAVVECAKANGGLDGHRIVDPHALAQSLINKINTFEESSGVLVWRSLVHVEALQLSDMPLLIRHCSTVLEEIVRKGIDVQQVRRQESVVLHYIHCMMQHCEKLNTREMLELMEEAGLVSKLARHLANQECPMGLRAVGTESLSMLADCEEFQCDWQRFFRQPEDLQALAGTQRVVSMVLEEGMLKKPQVRPLLDLLSKLKRMR